jgi:hypothetical protein
VSDILHSAKAHDWYAHDETLAEELIDEIERLRDVIDRAAKAWLSIDRIAWEGDVGDAMAAAVKEIERLRGLLRDVMDGLDDYWVTTPEGISWLLHCSDALGE